MQPDAVRDGTVKFAYIAIDLEMPPGQMEVVLGRSKEVLENRNQREICIRIALAQLLLLEMIVELTPAYPLAIIPNRVLRPEHFASRVFDIVDYPPK